MAGANLPFGNMSDTQLDQLYKSGQLDQETYESVREMRGSQTGGTVFKALGLSQVGPRAQSVAAPSSPKSPDVHFNDTVGKVLVGHTSKTKGGPVTGPIGQIREGEALYQQGVSAEGVAIENEANQEAGVYQGALEGSQRFDATYASIERRRQMAQQVYADKAERLRSDADLMVRYPGMDVEDTKKLQQSINEEQARYANSTNGTERLKSAQNIKKMQAKLVSAQHVDDSGGLQGGQRIMAAIAMALGAYGSALARIPNYAMQTIQAQIDRNVASQREAFARRERVGEKKQTIADQMVAKKMAEYQDEFQQTQAAEVVYWQQAKRQLEQVAVRAKAPQARANAQKLAGDFEAKIGEKIAAIMQRGEQLEISKLAIEARRKHEPDEFAATKSDLRRLIALREQHGSEHGGGNVQSTMETLHKSLIFRIGALHNQKRMSDKDAEILEQMLGSPTGFGWQSAKMKEALRVIEGIEAVSRGQTPYSPEEDDLLSELGEPQ